MDGLYIVCLAIVGLLIFVASIDDLIVDILIALKLRTPRIGPVPSIDRKGNQKPKIAIFVANWHEADVLGRMVEGNLENLDYRPLKFVLGVYPNDTETRRVAEEVAKKHPDLVQVVVNRRNGPTSKGQMLNEMFAHVYADPENTPDLVIMHDSEDMIAPRSFDVYAHHARDSALIQIPVFSLDSRRRSLVGATYMEEFAERHTREMLLRSQLGAFVPSAGVGTGLRKDLIQHLLNMRGYVFQAGSVTEDYVLGAEAHEAGFKTTFAAHRSSADPHSQIIATLEYFPKDFWASIKQKTRWVYGIAFHSAFQLGWNGQGWNRFFLYRDRKGSIANLLPVLSLAVLGAGLILQPDFSNMTSSMATLLSLVLAINTINILLRIYFRAIAFHAVYGTHNILGLLLRWPVSFCVNATAAGRAWRMFVVESGFATKPVAWSKTQHEIPDSFVGVHDLGTRAQPAPVRIPIKIPLIRPMHMLRHPGFQSTAAIGFIALAFALASQVITPATAVYGERAKARVAAFATLEKIRISQQNLDSNIKTAREASRRYASLIMDSRNNRDSGNVVRVIHDNVVPQHAPPRTTRAKFIGSVQKSLSKSADADLEFLALVDFKRDSGAGTKIVLHSSNEDEITNPPSRYSLLKSRRPPKYMTSDKRDARSDALRYAKISLTAARTHDQVILHRHKSALRNIGSTKTKTKNARKLAQLSIIKTTRRDSQILASVVRHADERVSPPPTSKKYLHATNALPGQRLQLAQASDQVGDHLARPQIKSGGKADDTAYSAAIAKKSSPQSYQWAAARIRSETHDHVLTLSRSTITASKNQDQIFFGHIKSAANFHDQLIDVLSLTGAENLHEQFHAPIKNAEAKFLARVAIALAEKNDALVLKKKIKPKVKTDLERSILEGGLTPIPAELQTVSPTRLPQETLAKTNKHNALILSTMIDGVPNKPDLLGTKRNATRAVIEAQRQVNVWLLANKLTLKDLDLTSIDLSCGNLLCADGVLGTRTKRVIDLISRHDKTFWRHATQRKVNKVQNPK